MPITLTVEDGTGLENANAYVSMAYVDAYHAERGRASWDNLADEAKKACIVRATDYVDFRFGRRFRGRKMTRNQSRCWPRTDAYDNGKNLYSDIDAVPRNLQKAVAEYALRAGLVGELAPDPIPFVPHQDLTVAEPEVLTEHTGGQIRRVDEKVDKIEEAKTYQTQDQINAAAKNKIPLSALVTTANIPEYPAADLLLEELIDNISRRVVRA